MLNRFRARASSCRCRREAETARRSSEEVGVALAVRSAPPASNGRTGPLARTPAGYVPGKGLGRALGVCSSDHGPRPLLELQTSDDAIPRGEWGTGNLANTLVS